MWTGARDLEFALDGDRGIVAEIGNPAMPRLAVSDPQDLCDQSGGVCQYSERRLAHEVGQLLSLVHVATGGGTNDTALTQAELDQARDYLNDNSGTFGFDIASGADFTADATVPQDAGFDKRNDTKAPPAADMHKVIGTLSCFALA